MSLKTRCVKLSFMIKYWCFWWCSKVEFTLSSIDLCCCLIFPGRGSEETPLLQQQQQQQHSVSLPEPECAPHSPHLQPTINHTTVCAGCDHYQLPAAPYERRLCDIWRCFLLPQPHLTEPPSPPSRLHSTPPPTRVHRWYHTAWCHQTPPNVSPLQLNMWCGRVAPVRPKYCALVVNEGSRKRGAELFAGGLLWWSIHEV